MKTWYLAYCKRKEEERAKIHLKNQGVDSYYPMVEVERIIRGRLTRQQEPMFPNYLFVHVNLDEFPATRLRSTRGLSHMIRFGDGWSKVPRELIYQLMRHEDSDEARELLNHCPKPGARVCIEAGPMQGLEAIYQEPDGERRSILLINMLNKQVPTSFCNRSFRVLDSQANVAESPSRSAAKTVGKDPVAGSHKKNRTAVSSSLRGEH